MEEKMNQIYMQQRHETPIFQNSQREDRKEEQRPDRREYRNGGGSNTRRSGSNASGVKTVTIEEDEEQER